MKFAYFTHVWGRPGITPGQRYAELWREIRDADRLGLDYAFSVEHHCTPHESWMSSPAVFCTGAALHTERIRVGPMGWVPPLRHPMHLVEEVATLDHLLGGRLEVGLASGVSPEPFLPFGADFAGRHELTREAVELLRTALGTDGTIDFEGPVHRVRDVTLSFPSLQRPHPPLWVPTTNRNTLRHLSSVGAHTGSTMIVPRASMGLVYRHYLDWWRGHGHATDPDIGYWTLVHVAPTDAEAEARAAAHITETFTKTLQYSSVRRSGEQHAPASKLSTPDILAGSGDFGFLLDHNLVFVGSPQTVTERIRAAAAEGHFNTVLGEFAFGGLEERHRAESLELFAREVIPALRDHTPYAPRPAYTQGDEEQVAARLQALGYLD
ncbi:LLM class flavin-dependent oxidoreductase [Streptomyces roseoverticillatus]|uniref:LLM class flavin-dependent oxidoreductase n=1 Tax=Streptomyces roseoverticillatus TaxID=66429 RepID=UPI000694D88C|nr:LLM class flavin-dependent oxidoreductase [Streptomyces roseoverticillatus]